MCLRDGKLSQKEAASLVPGDVVYVRMGDKTPADILVFSASDCNVDNSSLTGESEPQERMKSNDMENPLEATNLMFNSTLVVSGEAYGIVIRTGDGTVLGQIARLTAGEEKTTSPLTHEIDNFVKLIATIAILTAIIFFGICFPVNNNNVDLAINFAIGIFVAWVPEGLPATVTMLLTIAAKRMATQNVLVKHLQGVETLGAITLLATDKVCLSELSIPILEDFISFKNRICFKKLNRSEAMSGHSIRPLNSVIQLFEPIANSKIPDRNFDA
jgi:sodium/potassium-transporting ATPase subunit alpha